MSVFNLLRNYIRDRLSDFDRWLGFSVAVNDLLDKLK